MKTWKVVKKNGNECWVTYTDDSFAETDGNILRFRARFQHWSFSKEFDDWEEYSEVILKNTICKKTETPEMRIHRLETDRNELRATLLALQATVDDMQVMLDANNL